MKRKTQLLFASAATALAFGGALAQAPNTSSANAQQAAGAPSELEEIVVTALRREESISKTPMAITAVSAEELQKAGVVNVVQLQYLAPSMQVTQTGQGVYVSIRGVTTTDRTSKGEPGIQFNTDGVPVNQPEEQAIALFDVQRVEVLSGPQGTLYGKSSTGGAINVLTNAPAMEEAASAGIELGNYNTKRINAMINEPLGDNWAVRLAGVANSRKGYVHLVDSRGGDEPGDEGNAVGRLSLMGHLSDAVQLRLTGTGGRIDSVGFGGGSTSVNIASDGEVKASLDGQANPFPGRVRDDFQRGNVQLDADMGPTHLVYIGSKSHYKTNNTQSNIDFGAVGQGTAQDGTRLRVRDTYDSIYHELRLSNTDDSALQWIVGANYFSLDVDENGKQQQIATAPSTACPANPGMFDPMYCRIVAAGGSPLNQNNFQLINETHHKSYSAFAHGVYALTPDWHLTVGLREGTDEISRDGALHFGAPFLTNAQGTLCIDDQVCVGGLSPTGLNSGNNNTGEGKSSKLVWNVGTDYQFSPTQFGYASVSTGYKAGGFNDFDGRTGGNFSSYGPENMIAYQVGYKQHSNLFDFTSSVYFYDYSSNQLNGTYTFLIPGNPAPQNFGLTLGLPTQLYGWENSVKWLVSDNDVLTLGADFQKSKFNGGNTVFSGVDFNGKSLNSTPASVLSAGLTHTFNLGSGAKVLLHADTRVSSSYDVSNYSTGQRYYQKGFSRSNANLSYESADGRLQTELFINNIEDKVQVTGTVTAYQAGTVFPTGYAYQGTAQVSQPMLWGIRQSIKF